MPCILLSHRQNMSSRAKDNHSRLFSTVSSGFICKGFLIWDKHTVWSTISFSELPENCICPSKFPLDFIISNSLFKELYWKSGFPEQGTCDDSDSDKLLLLSHIMSSDPANLQLVTFFLHLYGLKYMWSQPLRIHSGADGLIAKWKQGNPIRLLKGEAFWCLTNALSTFRFPLNPLRYDVCLESELYVGGLPQCSFISTLGNTIPDTSELCDHTNTINTRNPETAASA